MHLVRAFKVLLMVVPVMKRAVAYLCCTKSLYLQVLRNQERRKNTSCSETMQHVLKGLHRLCGCDTHLHPLTDRLRFSSNFNKRTAQTLKKLGGFNGTTGMCVLLFGILMRGLNYTVWENSQAPFIIQGSVRDICFPH